MSMNEKDLLDLKDRIEEADRNAVHLEGQMSSLMDNLEQMGHSSVKEAKKELEKLDDKIEKKEELLNKAIREVEERYAAI